MASPVQIYNMGLAHLGQTKRIASFDEQSEEARLGSLVYETCRDTVLEAFNWPFATKLAALALVAEDPNDEWAFSYRYPSDCLKFRKILSGVRNDSRDTRIPFRISKDNAGKLIFVDKEDAQGEWTVKVTDTQLFSPSYTLALSYYIAHIIAPAMTAGDPFKLGERARQLYEIEIQRAAAHAFNEEQPEQHPESEFIRARG